MIPLNALLLLLTLSVLSPDLSRAQQDTTASAAGDTSKGEVEEKVFRFTPSPYRIQRVHLPPGERGPQAGVSRGRYIVNFGTRDGVQPGSIFRALYRGQLMGLLKTTRTWRDTTELTLVRLVHKSDVKSPYPLNTGYYLEPQLVLLETIYFEAGEPVIDPDMYERLRYAARFVRSFPTFPLVIEGHTDSRGKADENMTLSQRRAEGVRVFLNEVFRIPLDQLHAVGYGKNRPVASNLTPEGRYANRRVDIVLVDKLPAQPGAEEKKKNGK